MEFVATRKRIHWVFLYEALGTCFLVYAVNMQDSFAFGQYGIAFMLYSWLIIGGGITGGHYNSAVTLGVLIADRHMCADLIPATIMIAGQYAGGALGIFLAYLSLVD